MKLLIDQNLPTQLARLLAAHGHDSIHTEDVELQKAADPTILSWCCAEGRMLVTADKKLTKFVVTSGADCPSVLITRDLRTQTVDRITAVLVANLPQIEQFVADRGNALFSLTPTQPIRAELLPVQAAQQRPES